MSADERWFQGHLHELDEEECWELVRSREVGRMAYDDDRGPMVVPVTFVLDGETVLFRVAPYSQLARHLPDARAAFEVDEIDYFTRTGWSVVLRGSIERWRATTSGLWRTGRHRGRKATAPCTSG